MGAKVRNNSEKQKNSNKFGYLAALHYLCR